jgi:hypothetical protein
MSGTDAAESLRRTLDRDPVSSAEAGLLATISVLYVTGGLSLPGPELEIAMCILIITAGLRVVSYYLGRFFLFVWFPEIAAREEGKYGKGSRSNK